MNGRPYVALIGLLGLIAGLFYSVNPIQFMSRGLGEITIFFAFGPLITWGTYYVLTNQFTGPGLLPRVSPRVSDHGHYLDQRVSGL